MCVQFYTPDDAAEYIANDSISSDNEYRGNKYYGVGLPDYLSIRGVGIRG